MHKALLIFFSQSQNQVANNPLTGELKKIFPALSRGYIDLNQVKASIETLGGSTIQQRLITFWSFLPGLEEGF